MYDQSSDNSVYVVNLSKQKKEAAAVLCSKIEQASWTGMVWIVPHITRWMITAWNYCDFRAGWLGSEISLSGDSNMSESVDAFRNYNNIDM